MVIDSDSFSDPRLDLLLVGLTEAQRRQMADLFAKWAIRILRSSHAQFGQPNDQGPLLPCLPHDPTLMAEKLESSEGVQKELHRSLP